MFKCALKLRCVDREYDASCNFLCHSFIDSNTFAHELCVILFDCGHYTRILLIFTVFMFFFWCVDPLMFKTNVFDAMVGLPCVTEL